MNNAIFTNLKKDGSITVKVISETLKNKSGNYSTKNKYLVDILNSLLKLKNIGDNILTSLEFGEDGFVKSKVGNFKAHDASKNLHVKDVANLLENFSITFSDRCFIPSWNKNHQLIVTMLSKEKFPSVIFVREKNSEVTATLEVKNIFDESQVETINLNTSKGVRLLKEEDVAYIVTAFNSMLGLNYNKPLFEKIKKNA